MIPLTPHTFKHTLLLYIIGVWTVKFKIIFALFNIVVLFSFIIIFFMPLIMLGWTYTKEFWVTNWYLPILFITVMGLLNAYFISNWKLFNLLETENWEGIRDYTLKKLNDGKFRKQHVKVLINASLVSNDLKSILTAESVIREKKPSWLSEFALSFGIPYLLNNDPAAMEKYYSEFLDIKTDQREWILWSYCFSLIMQKRFEQAKSELIKISDGTANPVVLALTGYLVSAYARGEDDEMENTAASIKMRIHEKFTKAKWMKEVEKSKENIQAAILSKLIDDAGLWLYDGTEAVDNDA